MKLTKEQQQEIKDQQSQSNKTKRVTVTELEKILYEAIPILDHGFVRVIDYMQGHIYCSSCKSILRQRHEKVSTDQV